MPRALAMAAALVAALAASPPLPAQDAPPIPLPPPEAVRDAGEPDAAEAPKEEAKPAEKPESDAKASDAKAGETPAKPATEAKPEEKKEGEETKPAEPAAPAPKPEPAAPAAPAAEPERIEPPPGPFIPPDPDTRIKFQFKDASIESVLKYVSEQLGVTFIKEAREKIEGTVSAVSTEGVPAGKVLGFLNSVLKPKGLTTLQFGEIVKIVDVDEAKRRNIQIYVGSDPDQIELSDTIITQVVPLQYAVGTELLKEMTNVISKTGELAANARSNTLVLTDTSANVHRFVRIIKELDKQLFKAALIRIHALKHADAAAVSTVLKEIFGQTGSGRGSSGSSSPWQMFFNRGSSSSSSSRSRSSSSVSANPRMQISISSDQRTNSVIVITNEEFHALVEEVIRSLDVQMSDLLQVKVYMLQHADASDTVRIIKEILPETTSQSSRSSSRSSHSHDPRERFASFLRGRSASGNQTGNLLPNQKLELTADSRTNSIVCVASKEYQDLVKEIIAGLDSQIAGLLKIRVYQLKNADAVQLADTMRSTFLEGALRRVTTGRTGSSGGALPSDTFDVTADARTNTLIIRATEDNLRELDILIKALDGDATEESSTVVVPLKNANAENVASILQQLLRSTGGTGGARTTAGRTTTTGRTPTSSSRSSSSRSGSSSSGRSSSSSRYSRMAPGGDPDSQPMAPGADPAGTDAPLAPGDAPTDTAVDDPYAGEGARTGPGGVSGQVDVRADGESNAVLVRTAPRNLDAVRKLIAELDQVRPQVLIKVLIAEVSLDDTLRFGVQGFWENGWRINDEIQTQRYGTNFGADFNVVQPSGSGFLYRLSGDEMDLRLQALNKDGRLKVLSTPRILALHNEQASINVGKDIPEVVSTRYDSNGNQINTIQRRDIGIILEVTPRINPDGLVTMIVHPEVSVLAPNSESVEIQPGVFSPVINRNFADTTVAVPHGQTVVIGGLIREIENTTVNKIPILGDIPLLGYLFRTDEVIKQQAELMIFLTPFVVSDGESLREMSRLEQAQLKILTPGDVKRHVPDWEFEPRE